MNYATESVIMILDNDGDDHRRDRPGRPHKGYYTVVTERYAVNPPDSPAWIRDYVERLSGQERETRPGDEMVSAMVNAGLAEVEWHLVHDHYLDVTPGRLPV